MDKPTKKPVLVCALLAMLVCNLPFAPFYASATPLHKALHIEEIDMNHLGSFLPQEWGLTKTTATAMRSLAALSFETGMVVQYRPVPSEPCADGVFTALGAQLAASGLAYLNNLAFRC